MYNQHSELTVKDARELGIDKGNDIAFDMLFDTEVEWLDSISEVDDFLSECSEIEVHQRCYSPFEEIANEFNVPTKAVWVKSQHTISGYCDEPRIIKQDSASMWEAYENGVRDGAAKAWRRWFKG